MFTLDIYSWVLNAWSLAYSCVAFWQFSYLPAGGRQTTTLTDMFTASSSNDRQRSRWRRRRSSDNNNRRHLSRRRRRRQTTAMETAAAPTTAARSTSSVTATAAPPAATTAATTAASTAAAQERSRLETAHRGRATWCSRAKTAASTPPAAVSHRTRETERETRKLNGECSVVGGPSGVSRTKAKVRCAMTPVIQSPTRLRISGPWVTLQRRSG